MPCPTIDLHKVRALRHIRLAKLVLTPTKRTAIYSHAAGIAIGGINILKDLSLRRQDTVSISPAVQMPIKIDGAAVTMTAGYRLVLTFWMIDLTLVICAPAQELMIGQNPARKVPTR